VVEPSETIDLVSESSSSDESVVEVNPEPATDKKESQTQRADITSSEVRARDPSRAITPAASSPDAAQGVRLKDKALGLL
jgi:hypothetical protein